MNKQKQQEAMARLDGQDPIGWNGWSKDEKGWKRNGIYTVTDMTQFLPEYPTSDYHTDNEIDRMVRELVESTLWAYTEQLELIVIRDMKPHSMCDSFDEQSYSHQATAEQKVEAYLKAKGEWT